MAGELEALLNEMKEKGIGGAIVRIDGVPVQSTIALSDVGGGLISAVSNISDALMKRANDQQKEIEVSFEELILVMVPINNHIFCGLVKDREGKKLVVEYAERARPFLGK